MARKTTTIRTFRAGAVGRSTIPNLVIRADQEASMIGHSHVDEGRRIADALYQHLPGGTLDQVLLGLLRLTASQLRVPHRRKR